MARRVRPADRTTDQAVLVTAAPEPASAERAGRRVRVGLGLAGLTLLAGVAACSPSTAVQTSSSSPLVAPSTTTAPSYVSGYGSSSAGSAYGSSGYGSSSSGASGSSGSSSSSSSSGSSGYGSSGSSGSSDDSSSSSSSSGSSSGSPYAGTYTNSDGQQVERPDANSSGATARCKDGTDSHSKHKSGTCSGHGGVDEWL